MRKQDFNLASHVPGQDSFLDVVCNFVGILIVFILLVGLRLKKDATEAALDRPPPLAIGASAQPSSEPAGGETTGSTASASLPTAEIARAAEAVELDLQRSVNQIGEMTQLAEVRFAERNRLQTLVVAAERLLSEQRQTLSEEAKVQFDLARSLSDARAELDDVLRKRETAETAAKAPQVLEHRPTPLARTVFGREEHFLLSERRLSYVPWNELVEQLKREFPSQAARMTSDPVLSATLGPVGDFRMEYTLRRVEHQYETRSGAVARQGVELDHFTLHPIAPNLGEALDRALSPASQFRLRLDGMDRDRTTITVWVYPDSFAEFRTLKKALFDAGFLVAGRPLPTGSPIGGSPRGSKSGAQ